MCTCKDPFSSQIDQYRKWSKHTGRHVIAVRVRQALNIYAKACRCEHTHISTTLFLHPQVRSHPPPTPPFRCPLLHITPAPPYSTLFKFISSTHGVLLSPLYSMTGLPGENLSNTNQVDAIHKRNVFVDVGVCAPELNKGFLKPEDRMRITGKRLLLLLLNGTHFLK